MSAMSGSRGRTAGGPPISDDGRFWWDGANWQPITASAQTGSGVGKIIVGVVLALAIVLFGLWIINVAVTSDDHLQCATENMQRADDGRALLDCPE